MAKGLLYREFPLGPAWVLSVEVDGGETMESTIFTDADRRQFKELDVTEEEVLWQLRALTGPAPQVHLARPCTVGDGIRRLTEAEEKILLIFHEEAAAEGRCIKFVPASGAASRMVAPLVWFHGLSDPPTLDELGKEARAGDPRCKELLRFFEALEDFAFFEELEGRMAEAGWNVRLLKEQGRLREIVDFLLSPAGLGWAELPKGLFKFHRYPEGSRTAFEEHLVEAAQYVRDKKGECRIHFTVAPGQRGRFELLWKEMKPLYEARYDVRFRVTFSVQRPSTDTISLDQAKSPVRLQDGRLFFRPGGHGALIWNLNELRGDIVFIKNIDNVVPDRLKGPTILWKKLLAGHLIRVQREVFSHLEALASGGVARETVQRALDFARRELFISWGEEVERGSTRRKREFLLSKLDRPIRVCGVVRNQGEPGGAPFWVEGPDGSISLQIVEESQVDLRCASQRKIWGSSTHFNPVDIVCGLRDRTGAPFDLMRFVDPSAFLVTRKSRGGEEIRVLERPGLWNGAMAGWLTLFVEVPLLTFNPVKGVNDLLRPEHRPL